MGMRLLRISWPVGLRCLAVAQLTVRRVASRLMRDSQEGYVRFPLAAGLSLAVG